MERFIKPEWKNYIKLVVSAAAVIISLKYLLPLVLPFFLALCMVSPLYPFLERAERRLHIGKSVLVGGILCLAAVAVGALLWFFLAWFCSQLSVWMGNLDMVEDCFCSFVQNGCRLAERRLGIDGKSMERMLLQYTDGVLDDVQVRMVPEMMNHSVAYMKSVLALGGFLAITLIATILLAKDYGKLREGAEKISLLRRAEEIGAAIGLQVAGYLKAQLIIMTVITLISISSLYLAGIENWLMVGFLAGCLDALPFIGTGIVLLPVALWQLLQGKIAKAFGCLLIYAVCVFVREFLEPKLIGRKMGIYPVVVLLTIYAGLKIYGLSGVVLGPFSYLVIREIAEKC